MDYDIYLQTACRAQPDLEDLLETIPALGTSAVQAKLTAYPSAPPGVLQHHPPRPGFLGLELEKPQAQVLNRRLAAVQAQGEVLPTSYRDPKITEEQAQKLAEQEMLRLQQQRVPTDTFDPVRLWQEEIRWWVFTARKRRVQAEKRVLLGSGGPMIYVDKVDGHIVEDEEIQTLEQENL